MAQELQKAGMKEKQETSEISDAALKYEDDEAISPCLENSLKSRRKISKPKHYKPTANGQDNEEHNGISQTPADLNRSTYSPESVIQEQLAERLPENAVHVLTANHGGKKVDSSTTKRAASQKQKRTSSTGKSSNKKGKNDTPTVPRKPEDLIREAMMMGQSAPPASKRDAQYRKSYAYKIWKERGSQELKTDTDEGNGVNTPKNKLPPGPIQNQARAAFYWPGTQYNEAAPPGFFANGKFYAINPQMIPTVHGRPDIPPSSPMVPVLTAATSAHTIQNSVIQSSKPAVISSGQQIVQYSGVVASTGIENPRQKIIPPNVTVVPQYPPVETTSPRAPKPAVKSPVVKFSGVNIPPPMSNPSNGTKPVSPAPVSQMDTGRNSPSENGVPAKNSESPEPKASSAAMTSPSNLVSLMKTSLRQKHSKENVQPLPNMFKNKRKLESDKFDGPPAKKTGKPTIFTPLNEQEAEKLANDIYDVNLEYFPFQTLAGKAAQSKETLSETPETLGKADKVKEIEKVRCLLKDFYDVTYSCTEDPDMEKFDSASRKFGRKNILNHLSLLDRYFAELQKKLDT